MKSQNRSVYSSSFRQGRLLDDLVALLLQLALFQVKLLMKGHLKGAGGRVPRNAVNKFRHVTPEGAVLWGFLIDVSVNGGALGRIDLIEKRFQVLADLVEGLFRISFKDSSPASKSVWGGSPVWSSSSATGNEKLVRSLFT